MLVGRLFSEPSCTAPFYLVFGPNRPFGDAECLVGQPVRMEVGQSTFPVSSEIGISERCALASAGVDTSASAVASFGVIGLIRRQKYTGRRRELL